MAPWRPLQLLLLFLLAFALSGTETQSSPAPVRADAANVISAPRESLPPPVHNEATCAFCQAAIFAPHAGGTGDVLPLVWGTEQSTHLSYDESVTHADSSRPPRSRAPPAV